jgi:hypothetical protein
MSFFDMKICWKILEDSEPICLNFVKNLFIISESFILLSRNAF